MASIIYQIVQHDGGWAYKVDETFSEPFSTRASARRAAQIAAREQRLPGPSQTEIVYEDKQGRWHDESSRAEDRPETLVKG